MTSCAACGASDARELWRVRDYPVVACRRCGLARTELPPGFDPASIYTQSYFDGGQTDAYMDYQASADTLRAEFARTLDVLVRHGAERGSLIEIGCAYGYFLDVARERFSVAGVEVSDPARDACRSRGLEVERELSPELRERRGPFDAAVLLDVIEHLADPAGVLATLRGAMRTGGRILLTTGDFGSLYARLAGRRWRLMTPPQHLWFFTRATLEATLQRSGFRLRGYDHPWKLVPLSMVVYQGLRLAGRSAPEWARKLPGGLPVNLFDAMRLVAEAV
ncbi:MAG TPA: class I SAM-dependent methyltransferase [Polyangiaceae bacterium]|nr:class I SAM-dependent methyltransferase [Polyangiaceae bacterium]